MPLYAKSDGKWIESNALFQLLYPASLLAILSTQKELPSKTVLSPTSCNTVSDWLLSGNGMTSLLPTTSAVQKTPETEKIK